MIGLNHSDKEIIQYLRSLGKISSDYQYIDLLIEFTENNNKDIRYYSVQNLAKLPDESLLSHYEKILKKEKTSIVRREIVSAIGRLRSELSIPILLRLLKDRDPNIILQSIRGLLVFKQQKLIYDKLIFLRNHPNEIVRKVIDVEFFDSNKYQKEHYKSPDNLKNCILNGDVLEILNNVDDESIHLTFTSPPYYNARDYSVYDSYNSYL